MESYCQILNEKNNLESINYHLGSDLHKILTPHYSEALDRIWKLQGSDHKVKLKWKWSQTKNSYDDFIS